MSYRMVPVYKCALCGDEAPSSLWETGLSLFIGGIKYLPDGWVGSERKKGECYCERCKYALYKVMENMEVD